MNKERQEIEEAVSSLLDEAGMRPSSGRPWGAYTRFDYRFRNRADARTASQLARQNGLETQPPVQVQRGELWHVEVYVGYGGKRSSAYQRFKRELMRTSISYAELVAGSWEWSEG